MKNNTHKIKTTTIEAYKMGLRVGEIETLRRVVGRKTASVKSGTEYWSEATDNEREIILNHVMNGFPQFDGLTVELNSQAFGATPYDETPWTIAIEINLENVKDIPVEQFEEQVTAIDEATLKVISKLKALGFKKIKYDYRGRHFYGKKFSSEIMMA